MREKHGLDPDRTTILVSAGGFGVGPVERLVGALLELRHPAQVVVICGRSEELRGRLDGLAAAHPSTHPVVLTVVGYTTEMDEYMAAADLLVGKPGGLTTSEALARGLPMVIVNPIPGRRSETPTIFSKPVRRSAVTTCRSSRGRSTGCSWIRRGWRRCGRKCGTSRDPVRRRR